MNGEYIAGKDRDAQINSAIRKDTWVRQPAYFFAVGSDDELIPNFSEGQLYWPG